MKQYHFSVELAQEYGVNGAILLHHIAYWVQKNQSEGVNIVDGVAWTYATQSGLAELFPFWSRRQIQRILAKLEEQGAIKKDRFNNKGTNRTTWYTICSKILDYYHIQTPLHQTGPSIEPNGTMQCTERVNAMNQTVQCYKDNIKAENKSTLSLPIRADLRGSFDQFWSLYPRKEGKKKAWETWQKLKPDEALFAAILSGLENHRRSEQWKRGVIPHATTWLNGERWMDELAASPTGVGSTASAGSTAITPPAEDCPYV